MSDEIRHLWLVGPFRADRQAYWENYKSTEGGVFYATDCHANLRGPYTGVGSLLRQMIPSLYVHYPELVDGHAVEILSLAPELRASLTVATETLTSLAVPDERTRFYSRMRTLRLTHGLIDFLKNCIAQGVFERLILYFENIESAESLDREFLSVLLRRADPRFIQVIVASSAEIPPDPLLSQALETSTQRIELDQPDQSLRLQRLVDLHLPMPWKAWLLEQSQGWLGEWQQFATLTTTLEMFSPQGTTWEEGLRDLLTQVPEELRLTWARAFIDADGTSENWLERAAYEQLETSLRQQLHDARADALGDQKQWSLHLGAIPYHRERGQDSAHRGAKALQEALDYCINIGYYEATVDFGNRGRKVIDWATQEDLYWVFTTKNTTSLAALGRPEEAELLYNEARALSCNPSVHMQAAYATAMLYTRHHDDERRNHTLAKAWANQAIAIASLLPNPKDRVFNTVFNQNGLALIETRLGHSQDALRLVTEGLAKLDKVLDPEEHLLHRSVLIYNRGQVYAGVGKIAEALADYTRVIELDPYYSEYYFDRANLYRQMQRNEEALADYEKAIAYSPPYEEAYYNRASVLSLLGRDDEALSDYSYVLELDPDYLNALINRASLFYELGAYDEARSDVEHGLALSPNQPQLLCTLGLLEMVAENPEKALVALQMALEYDPALLEAWINRAVLRYEQEDIAGAIEDLTRALALKETTTIFYNRGFAYQAQGDLAAAIADYTGALQLVGEDAQDTYYQRGLCYQQTGQLELARQDFAAHLALGASPYVEEITQFDPELISYHVVEA
jgi:tetratricopeptide (TPR) repeat protein